MIPPLTAANGRFNSIVLLECGEGFQILTDGDNRLMPGRKWEEIGQDLGDGRANLPNLYPRHVAIDPDSMQPKCKYYYHHRPNHGFCMKPWLAGDTFLNEGSRVTQLHSLLHRNRMIYTSIFFFRKCSQTFIIYVLIYDQVKFS